jgi:hypothetical protein
MSFGGREMSILYRNGVCIPKLEPGNDEEELRTQVDKVSALHREDLKNGFGSVELPHRLAKKHPSAPYETIWQYLFPMKKLSRDPRTGIRG